MRLLILTPSVRPLGARRSLVELVRNLPPHVHPLAVCPGKTGIYEEFQVLGVQTAFAPMGAWRKAAGRATALFRQLPRLRRIVGKFRPDLLHANEYHIVPQAVYGGKGRPVCGHVRLSISPRHIRNYHLADCRRVIAVSEAVKDLFHDSPVFDRVRVVYNGVDVGAVGPEGPPHPEAAEWVASFGESAPLVCGLFGLVSERKNQLVAAEAVARANARGARVALLLAGDAFKGSLGYGEELAKRVGQDDLKGRVLWLPFQKDAAALYRSIDVNLLISSEEGFGRTIIEASAAERPSIGTRIGGIPELIREGETGWLVEEGNVEELAARLVDLSSGRSRIREAGLAARKHTEDRFTVQAHVRNVVDVWQECLEDSR